jgi:hypothetical protein
MDETTLNANINVLNAVTPHISNGTVLFTPVKLATKQHLTRTTSMPWMHP